MHERRAKSNHILIYQKMHNSQKKGKISVLKNLTGVFFESDIQERLKLKYKINAKCIGMISVIQVSTNLTLGTLTAMQGHRIPRRTIHNSFNLHT